MKKILNTYDIAHELLADENADWSRAGAFALAEYLEDLEEDTGEEMELDCVAIRCEFNEYDSLIECAKEYLSDERIAEVLDFQEKKDELKRADWLESKGEVADAKQLRSYFGVDHDERLLREWALDHGQLIEFDGGVIISSF